MDPSLVHGQFPTSYVRTRLDPELQIEHTIQDEVGPVAVDQEANPDAALPDDESLQHMTLRPGGGWVNNFNYQTDDLQLWLSSLPSPLPPAPFTPGSIAEQDIQAIVSVSPKGTESSQQPFYSFFDDPSLSPSEINRMADEFIAQLEKTPVTQEELDFLLSLPINTPPGSLGGKEPAFPVSVEPKDGMSMNTALKDTRRPPSTSFVSRSISPKSLTLKPLQFNSVTNSWPLPPIESVTRSFWDPIRDALREQVRIEKMEDTEKWIKGLPNVTEMLEPEIN